MSLYGMFRKKRINNRRSNEPIPELTTYIDTGKLDHKHCNGEWTLGRDGVLHFRGSGALCYTENFRSCNRSAERIVIDGFSYIGPYAFEGFFRCKEVTICSEHIQIGRYAFAHCSNLDTVCFTGSYEAACDAFYDTPYSADTESAGHEQPYKDPVSIASGGKQGKKFVKSLREEVKRIYTMKSPKPLSKGHGWTPDAHIWFSECVSILDKGARLGEAPMLYIAAELKMFSSPEYIQNKKAKGLGRELWLSDKRIDELYLGSAEKGFPYAMLWCAYCLSEGIHGFEKDEAGSDEFLSKLKGSRETLLTIGIPELRYLADEVRIIANEISEADLREDEVAFEYQENHISKDEYDRMDPDPDWQTLQLRIIELVEFMAALGLPYVLHRAGYWYEWDAEFDQCANRIRKVKTDWLDWCIEHGFLMSI